MSRASHKALPPPRQSSHQDAKFLRAILLGDRDGMPPAAQPSSQKTVDADGTRTAVAPRTALNAAAAVCLAAQQTHQHTHFTRRRSAARDGSTTSDDSCSKQAKS